MILFIYGPRQCGKSAYAEERACECGDNRIYLATMKIMDEEGKKRVAKHRDLRRDKGFITIECPDNVDKIDLTKLPNRYHPGKIGIEHGSDGLVILLECISNLVGNEMFTDFGIRTVDQTVETVIKEVQELKKKTDNLIIVSSIYDDEELTLDDNTSNYLEALWLVNKRLEELADETRKFTTGLDSGMPTGR